MNFIRKYLLLFVVCVTGGCVLIIEVLAVRILSSYYGNTIFSVSSVITVILAALSIGYYIGGRMADRFPSPKLFYGIILVSGLLVFILHLLVLLVLPLLGYRLSLVSGPLISSAFLFFLPGAFLGMLSPFAIKLQGVRFPEDGIGTVAGKVFFWSTFGSIVGSLLAGFVLIPHLGIDYILLSTGVVLSAIGLLGIFSSGVRKEKVFAYLGIAVFFVGTIFISFSWAKADVVYVKDGVYERVAVYDGVYEGKPARFLQQDSSGSSAMFLDSDDLVFDYPKFYALYRVFKPETQHVLVIGAGAYSIPRAFLQDVPEANVDVVEIEPILLDVGKQFFRVPDDPRLATYVEDGRRFLHDTDTTYDFIFSDVFFFSIPEQFTTHEFFELTKSRLSENGVLMVNVIGNLSADPPSFLFSEVKTIQQVFPQVYLFAVVSSEEQGLQNFILVGHNSKEKIDFANPALLASENKFIQQVPDKLIDLEEVDLSRYQELTDNFAPTEYFTAKAFVGQ